MSEESRSEEPRRVDTNELLDMLRDWVRDIVDERLEEKRREALLGD